MSPHYNHTQSISQLLRFTDGCPTARDAPGDVLDYTPGNVHYNREPSCSARPTGLHASCTWAAIKWESTNRPKLYKDYLKKYTFLKKIHNQIQGRPTAMHFRWACGRRSAECTGYLFCKKREVKMNLKSKTTVD